MKFDNVSAEKKYGKQKDVKKMAVMTQSGESVFIIAKDKHEEFNQERKQSSSRMDYSIIIRQSKQMQRQIEGGNNGKDEE